MMMFDESSLSPKSALDAGPARGGGGGAGSRRPSREEAFFGGGLSSVAEARAREELGAGDGRAPLGRMTSTHSLRSPWKLKYQDFIPERQTSVISSSSSADKAEPFAQLLTRANDWLRRTTDVQLKSCETVTWMSHDQKRTIDGEQMVLTQLIGENKCTYHIRGLRLWLYPSSSPNAGQTLTFVDIVPSRTDDVQSLIDKVNKKIARSQIKGHIFRIETLAVALDRGHIDPTITRWTENSNDDKQYVFILRIFILRNENEKIERSKIRLQADMKDFVPMPVDDSYEAFEVLVDRCNNWLRDQTDVTIVNLQSVMVQRGNGPFMEMSRSCHFCIPGYNSPEPLDVYRILRVAFLKPSSNGTSVSSPAETLTSQDYPSIWPLTFETFVPEMLRQKETSNSIRERMERMRETFSKVVAFLRISGADVIGAETVMNPIQLYVDNDLLNDDEQKFLFTLRIYLTGQVRALDGSFRSVKRASVNPTTEPGTTGTGAEDGGARNAPLFLGNVVQRRFKYRWLILALFGFTCMTIIVVVSVIYSNK